MKLFVMYLFAFFFAWGGGGGEGGGVVGDLRAHSIC